MSSKPDSSDRGFDSRPAPFASTRCVVVAEDDEGLNRVVCKRLERLGLTTVGVHSGADAIAAVREHPDCLLLLDYVLADMDGPQLLVKLDKAGLRVPFIVMTGRGDERVAVEMMKLGARDYLVKQPDFLELMPPVVERVLGQLETERKLSRTEAGLRESEERFRQAFEDSAIGKLFTGLDGRLLRVNRAFAAMLGYSIEELQSLDFQTVTHPDDVAESVGVMARLQTGTEGSARLEKR